MTNETKLQKIQEFSNEMGQYTQLFEAFLEDNWNQHDHEMVNASYLTLRDYIKGAKNFYTYIEETHPGYLEEPTNDEADKSTEETK